MLGVSPNASISRFSPLPISPITTKPGVNANADLEGLGGPVSPYLWPSSRRRGDLLELLNDLQPCPHGPLGIVFVGHRIAEVH